MASSIWIQLSSFSFLLSGVFSDLLMIRLFLLLAYLLLFLQAVLGGPIWPDVIVTDPNGGIPIPWDAFVWSAVCLYVHISVFFKLMMDERHIELNEDEEALWRMFYRRSGLTRILFKKYFVENYDMVSFEPGESIPDEIDGDKYIYILLEGLVLADVVVNGNEMQFTLYSGEIFDIKYLNVLGVHCGFMNQNFKATAKTKCKLFAFPLNSLKSIANGSETARIAWHSMLVSGMSTIAERPWIEELSDSAIDFKKDSIHDEDRRDPLFSELSPEEMMDPADPGSGVCLRRPFRNLWKIATSSFTLPWPCSRWIYGLRHHQMVPPNVVTTESFSVTKQPSEKVEESETLLAQE